MSDRLNLPASTRKKIERTLDKLIALLDAIDPDPNLEPPLGYNPVARKTKRATKPITSRALERRLQ